MTTRIITPLLVEKVKNILIAMAAIFILNSIAAIAFSYMFQDDKFKFINLDTTAPKLPMVLYVCLVAPFFEELVFRVLPFMFIRNTPNYERLKYPVLFLASIIFGWGHGTFINVYFQGIAGLFLGWVYLKNNFSYTSSVIVHVAWNTFLTVWIPIMMYHPIFQF